MGKKEKQQQREERIEERPEKCISIMNCLCIFCGLYMTAVGGLLIYDGYALPT